MEHFTTNFNCQLSSSKYSDLYIFSEQFFLIQFKYIRVQQEIKPMSIAEIKAVIWVVLVAVLGWKRERNGQRGDGGSVNWRIFWPNTSHLLATSSEASTSGCHGSAWGNLKGCGQPVCERVRWWFLSLWIGNYLSDTHCCYTLLFSFSFPHFLFLQWKNFNSILYELCHLNSKACMCSTTLFEKSAIQLQLLGFIFCIKPRT